jgi:uncharacterized delta-60 repeat protein
MNPARTFAHCDLLTRAAVALLLVVTATNLRANVPPAQATPRGMSTGDWREIRDAREASRHAFQATDGGHAARNPGQRWHTHFGPRGFLATPDAGGWQWGLELRSYGFRHRRQHFGDDVRPLVTAEGQRLTRTWHGGLQEWYLNDQRGLEHGFTLARRPDEAEENGVLTFELAVRGGLRAQVQNGGLSASFVSETGGAAVMYSGLKAWDADGRAMPARMVETTEGLRLEVEERGARYPLTIDPIAQQAYLKASDAGASDAFGFSVAISGDTAVIGAPNQVDENNGIRPGAAYVFVRNGPTWSQQAYLKASNVDPTENADAFGASVAIYGDTIVVGAWGEDSDATGVNGNQNNNNSYQSGAVYVFVRSGTTWTQQAYLKASTNGAGDSFGRSVAVSGDTLVVGANYEQSNATGVNGNQADNSLGFAGAAYVFTRSGTVWSQQAYLKASNTGPDDRFAESVAIAGDTVVVGAAGEDSNATGMNGNQSDNSATDSGAAYVFVRSGTTWTQQAYLKASNTGSGDRFGESVAVSGDTVAVGANGEASNAAGVNGNQADNSATAAGAGYVFTRSGTTWTQQAYLKASNAGSLDGFGASVAVSGDTVAVGANGEASNATGVNGNQADNSLPGAGAAYVFTRSGTTWTQQAYLKASNTGSLDGFGASVAVSGDTAVIGASGEDSGTTGVNGNQTDNSAEGAGAAYVFSGLPIPIIVVSGNGNTIVDGDPAAHAITGTLFGGTSVIHGPVITRSFNITNDGTGNLELGSLIFTGPAASDFSITAAPASSILPGSSTTFQIAFTPSARGPRNATVSFATNDFFRNPFDFAIQGIGRSSNADLSGLSLSRGALSPSFGPATTNYTASVRFNGSSLTATAAEFGTLQMRVNGSAYTGLASGAASGPLPLNVGANTVDVLVTSEDGRILKTYTVTITRAPIAPGDVEPGFRVIGNPHEVRTIAFQTDGKIVTGGYFNLGGQLGFPRNYLARFFADGTLDTSFTADPTNHSQAIVAVNGAAVQADGKIIVGGYFNSVGGAAFTNIARLNANSTPDTAFNPFLDYIVIGTHLQADGKVVIGGPFTSLGGSPRTYHGRLLPGGTLDAAYNANVNNVVISMAVQTNGQIVIAGPFDTVGGVTRHRVARLHANGTLDTGFADPFPAESDNIFCVAVQADGKVLVGGFDRIARFNADGTPDTAFNSNVGIVGNNAQVRSMVVQADGKIIAGGSFTTVGGVARTYVARLNANGTLDAPFNPNVTNDYPHLPNNNSQVHAIAQRGDGKVLVGGGFTDIDGVPRNGIALLHNDAATQSLGATSSSRVQWLRGGSAPETHMVTFELSTDGGTVFTPLGAGTRISGGWEITGLSLPASGHIRARARTTGAFSNGSSSLVETVEGFGANPNDRDNDGLPDSWEQTYWPVTTGHSALDDFDNDGYSELLELAFGLNPTQASPGGLPPVINEGGYLTMTITKHAGVTYEVQSAGTLMPGRPDSFSAASTTVLIDNATTLQVRDNVPVSNSPPTRFMRVRVMASP